MIYRRMIPAKLPNYLKMHRKEHDLSQDDVAFLLGWTTAGHVSRYEGFSRIPGLRTCLALSLILQVPVEELFAGEHQKAENAVGGRALRFAKRLQSSNVPEESRKLLLVKSIISKSRP